MVKELEDKQIAVLIKGVVFVFAAYLSSGIIVRLAGSSLPAAIPVENSVSVSHEKESRMYPIEHYEAIWEKSIFNPEGVKAEKVEKIEEVKVEEVVEEMEDINIPLSSLNYTLIGTVAGPDAHSFAIIKGPSAPEHELYRTGDAVGPAIIKKIDRNRVILNNQGREEMLEVTSLDMVASMSTGRDTGFSAAGAGVKKISANRFILDKKEVDSLSGDMSNFMAQARVVPNLVGGKPAGYKLLNVKRGSLVESIGLVNGDIIKEINGSSIDSPEKAFMVYQQLKDGGGFTVEIERKGKRETIQYDIR